MELADRVKRHFKFNQGEIKALAATITAYAIITSFSFEIAEPNILIWTRYIIPSFLITTLAIVVHVSAIRIYALKQGYYAEYRANYYVLALAFILSIVSRGRLFFIVPGIIMYHMLEGLRIGQFRYGINWLEVRWATFAGPIANLSLALFFRIISNIGNYAGNPLVEKAIIINTSIAFFSMLPLPDFEGLYIFFSSRLAYAFMFSVTVGACIAIYINKGLWISILLPLLMGAAGWLAYLIIAEMGLLKKK